MYKRSYCERTAATVLCLWLAGLGFAGQASQRLTLDEAIKQALLHQPNLASATAQKDAAKQVLRQAQSAFLPSLTAQYSHQETYSYSSKADTKNSSLVNRQGDLVLSYQLFDSGQRAATEQGARAGLRSASYAESDEQQTVIYGVASAFYTALRDTALVKVSSSQVDRSQAAYDLMKAQVQAGASAIKDQYQAEADLANAKVSLLEAQNNADIAKTQLKEAIGIESDAVLDLNDVPTVEGSTTEIQPLKTFLDLAYSTRADLKETEQLVSQQRAAVRLARASNSLAVSVTAGVTGIFVPDNSNNRSVGLTVSLPVFDGGYSRSAIAQAEATLRVTEATLKAKRISVATGVEQAYRNVTKARATVPASATAQHAAQVNYDAALASRKEEVGTIIDVINAQSQLVQAQTNYVNAMYDLYTAEAQLKRAIGQADQIAQSQKGETR